MNAKLRATLPLLLDLLIPTAGYLILHAIGMTDFWALTISGIGTALAAVTNTIRRGKTDRFGTLVILEIALSLVLLFITRDPKIILMKPSFYTALAGIYLLYTCAVGRAFAFELVRPFATRGDPGREHTFERAWADSAGFRRQLRLITAVWGVLWIIESIARIVVVARSSIPEGVFIGQLPAVIAIAAGIVFTRARAPKLRRYVLVQDRKPARAAPPSESANR
jgi:hypothetical protein